MKSFSIFGLGLLLLASLLSSCSKNNDMHDLQNYVKTIDAQSAKPIESLPQLPNTAAELISVQNSRDPFAPYINPNSLNQRPDATRPREPLEQFPLDAIKMVGTVTVDKQIWALIQVENGLYRIKVGQYIGQNAGQVVKISPDAVFVQETIPGGAGKWEKRLIEIKLNGQNNE